MKEEIFEVALADEAKLREVRGEAQLRHAYGAVPPGQSRISAPQFDMDRVWKLLDGAIDVHIHGGPDRIIAATDTGIFMSPSPLEAMRLYITGMLVREIPDRDVEKMVKTNPSHLLY